MVVATSTVAVGMVAVSSKMKEGEKIYLDQMSDDSLLGLNCKPSYLGCSTVFWFSTGCDHTWSRINDHSFGRYKEDHEKNAEVYKRRDVTSILVQRAERNGFKAMIFTVDNPRIGRREADIKNRLISPHLKNFEAIKAMEVGVAGIVVSNHGARQLDYSPATITVLEEVVHAVGGKIPVLIDRGVRRGTDIFKALALGAQAVMRWEDEGQRQKIFSQKHARGSPLSCSVCWGRTCSAADQKEEEERVQLKETRKILKATW
ncbi:hypothetical protein Vadar_023044 [Vaccinium darrowii]|uniref:Uncharacterized protein n=1 Tax=Vaccinium darrowii TaxID=229202 RepID=A0ACB7ZL88_9ERIC|nr:hypothetical protein Vadar_023044 [Vaccinium darrowii]